MKVSVDDHRIGYQYSDSILIEGFDGMVDENMFCIEAIGHRYHDYGIADHSLLLCSTAVVPEPEDLVICFEDDLATVYIFRPDATDAFDGEKRLLREPEKVDAVIISSFNYYR